MRNPGVKSIEDQVNDYEYLIGERIKLPKLTRSLDLPFGEVINNRKSLRKFKAITLAQLSELLWHTAKVKSFYLQQNGYILTHRGTPSAGARHPIDIIIYQPQLFRNSCFYLYNPFDHSLNQMINSSDIGLTAHVNEIIPISTGTLIWFVAHQQRTAAKYESPESLVWRDAGALINSIQLTCTAMELNSCPIGSLGEPFIGDFFKNQDAIFGAGGVLIG